MGGAGNGRPSLRGEERAAVAAVDAREHGMPPLSWLRGFEAAARLGSFTAAAQALGLTQAAVSYQIRSLEQHLGFALFERLAHGVRLTDMGKAYLPSIQKAFDEIAAATFGLFGTHGEAALAVRVPVSFGALWLAPRLPGFCNAHPGIAVRLYSAIWATAIPSEKVDVEVRIGTGHWPGFIAERLDDVPVVAVGRPFQVGRRKRLTAPDLLGRTFIEIMGVDDAWTRLFRSLGLELPASQRTIRVDSTLMALELAAAGMGYALVLRSLAAPYIEAGRLADVLGVERQPRLSHYLLQPAEIQRRKPEARLFVQWLFEEGRKAGLLPRDRPEP